MQKNRLKLENNSNLILYKMTVYILQSKADAKYPNWITIGSYEHNAQLKNFKI